MRFVEGGKLCECGGFGCLCVCSFAPSCLTLCDPMDCSLPGSSDHGILQARILEWIVIPLSRGSSQPRDRTQVSCITGRFFTNSAIREALIWVCICIENNLKGDASSCGQWLPLWSGIGQVSNWLCNNEYELCLLLNVYVCVCVYIYI